MKEAISPIVKRLNLIFNIMFGILILLLLAVMFGVISFNTLSGPAVQTAELYAIGLTLIAIPVSLRMHSNQVKRLQTDETTTTSQKIEGYTKAFVRRISILEVVALGNIVLFALMDSESSVKGTNNFMWLAVITLIAFVFCRASENELLTILQKEKETTDEK